MYADDTLVQSFLQPEHLVSAADVLSLDAPDLNGSGVYGFWLPALPCVPVGACRRQGDLYLQYLGVAAGQSIRSRLHKHLAETASVSTLRLSLGVIQGRLLCRAGRKEYRFCDEPGLSEWLRANARVSWVTCEEPHALEYYLLGFGSFPLNLQHNGKHAFCPALKAMRKAAKLAACQQK